MESRTTGARYRVSPAWDGTLGAERSYSYSYTASDGSLSAMTMPGGSFSYSYDGLKRLSSRNLCVDDSSFLTREYSYLAGAGTNGTTTLVSGLTNRKADNTVLSSYSYSYDAGGNILSVSGSDSASYTYDAQGQLLTEARGSGEDLYTAAYVYDTFGNLRSSTVQTLEPVPTPEPTPEPTPTPTPDLPGGPNWPFDPIDGELEPIIVGPITPIDPDPTPVPMSVGDETEDDGGETQTVTTSHTYTYGDSSWADLLTAYDGNPIIYDAIGNPTTWYDGAAMTWTNGRRLATISATNDHAALGFTYDADGLRLTKTVGTEVHRYTWQGGKLISESCGDSVLEFFYDESGAPYAFSYKANANAADQIFYYVTNLQGDVMQILDASGNTAASYTYNAWGKILNLNNSTSANIGDLNPIRYRGYYYDAETGLYYLKSRYYDPEICRFINADGFASTGQGFLGTNMFAYCGNNPILFSDPRGTSLSVNLMITDSGCSVIDITDKLNSLMELHNEELYEYCQRYGKLSAFQYFIEKVKTGGEWDFKNQESWQFLYTRTVKYDGAIVRFDDPGNIHFGFVGQALFGETLLCWGAGIYQILSGTSEWAYWTSKFDDPRDSEMIRNGYIRALMIYSDRG